MIALDNSSRELAFTARALSFDSKNYHTWAYRQWALCHFFSPPFSRSSSSTSSTAKQDLENRDAVWQGEIDYTDTLLAEDVRNNSAWNHRFFVAFESGQGGQEKLVQEREIEYASFTLHVRFSRLTIRLFFLVRFTKRKLALAPNNPSAWNYLRG